MAEKMELYRWQKNALAAWSALDHRGIVQAATGTGKTALALAAMDTLLQENPYLAVKIVVPTIPLARQWSEAILRHVDREALRPGFVGDGSRDITDRRVVIYIVNSARTTLAAHARRELALGHPLLLICDECHHLQSRQNRKVFDFITPEIRRSRLYNCLGLSATPLDTMHDEVLTEALGDVIFRYDVDRASRDGVLSPFVVCEVSAAFQPKELEEYQFLSMNVGLCLKKLLETNPKLRGMRKGGFMHEVSRIAQASGMNPDHPATAFLLASFDRMRLVHLAEGRLICCLALMERLPETNRILIFCERVSQAEHLASLIRRKMGNICGVYHSELKREARRRILNSFRNHEFRVLISCRCLDEGLDVPDADTAIVVSSTSVPRQRVQRLGRILRRAPGKSAACLYYLYIRESAEDQAYLPGVEGSASFQLRFAQEENLFIDEFYGYACRRVLEEARAAGYTPGQERTLRKCMEEGLGRGDYLLPSQVIREEWKRAETVRERNYWKTMAAIEKTVAGKTESGYTGEENKDSQEGVENEL